MHAASPREIGWVFLLNTLTQCSGFIVPFFQVSMFGTTFMALEAWISAAAVAHIYGKEPHQEDEYLSVNGREYSQHTVIGDGVSAEILRTFSLCICRAIPEVVRALRISVPLSTLELALVSTWSGPSLCLSLFFPLGVMSCIYIWGCWTFFKVCAGS